MEGSQHLLVQNWTIDYGNGQVEPVSVPHAWRQDVPVDFEGPVIYRAELEIPRKSAALRFHGVSYRAEVLIDGNLVAAHEGIWDAFDVPLDAYLGKRVSLEVRVTKNGGGSFPVRDVASGFLPYVFHTFGGIFREVELVEAPPLGAVPVSRVAVDGSRIFIDGKPFYMRGLLHWGWYPELGHPNPPEETIRAEVQTAKALGFNLIKFCLWVPPHRYLQILRGEGMEAWMELPLWNPNPERLPQIREELDRIVRQYRGHDNIVCWTIGCELGACAPAEVRKHLVQMVKNLTGCPLVRDDSGGAEMYGGDLREFGDFDDFHPYCDLPFYPPVLDSLAPGPRIRRPVLLGEFNDVDAHRDLARLADDMPFWGSNLSELNAQGVRWQCDLPRVLGSSRFADEPRKHGHTELMESSRRKALFIRKLVCEQVRAREAFGGYVVTGMRDTPISSAGMFDDWGDMRFSADECAAWNAPEVLFLIPIRRPPWVNGGNRAGWADLFNYFAGQVVFRVGLASEAGVSGGLPWAIRDEGGAVVAEGAEPSVLGSEPHQVAEIVWQGEPGSYVLECELGAIRNAWPFNVVAPYEKGEFASCSLTDPGGLFEGVVCSGEGHHIATRQPVGLPLNHGAIVFLTDEHTAPMPFWREAAYQFDPDACGLTERWEKLLAVSPDRAIDPAILPADATIMINRIDTRTYAEHPILSRAGNTIYTTLRPFGGLGIQPQGVARNPAGTELLRRLLRSFGA